MIERLSLGLVPLGNLYRAISDEQAASVLESWWDAGLRCFDVAPVYGYGIAERRLGRFLAGKRRDDFYLSTKAGRLIVPGAPPDPRMFIDGIPFFRDTPVGVNPVYDFSASGIRRSVEASMERLGVDRFDTVYIHDPDDHIEQATHEAYPALRHLREEGVISAIGIGVTNVGTALRLARDIELDAVMLASRYTILEQPAAQELLPLLTQQGTSLVAGGVLNTGFLAEPRLGAMYDYRPTTDVELVRRARQIADVCAMHGVPLLAAALQFPAQHPCVASIVVGAGTPAHARHLVELFRLDVRPALWAALSDAGLVATGSIPMSPTEYH